MGTHVVMGSPDSWREWGEDAPSWAIKFFLGDRTRAEIAELEQACGADPGMLEQLLDGIEDEVRVTITIERTRED